MVLTLGCGRFGFDTTLVLEPDAGPDAAPMPMVFTAGEPISELTVDGFESDDATLPGDFLEIYFASTRAGGGTGNIFRSERATPEDAWSAPELVPELSSSESESTNAISENGLWFLLGSRRDDPEQDVYLASRPDRSSPFGTPARLTEVSSVLNDSASWVSNDGLTVLIHSSRDGDFDVYRATRATTSELFSSPTLVEGLSSPGLEISATVYDDASLALFTYRTGTDDHDLHVAFGAPGAFSYGERRVVGGVATDAIESDGSLSKDRCRLIFSRVVGDFDQIFEATCIAE